MKLSALIASIGAGGLLLLATACGNGENTSASETPDQTGAPLTFPTAGGASATVLSTNQQVGLWITGMGKVTVVPDLAILSLGVESEARTVAEAQRQATEAMNKVFEALKARGLSDRDIRTSQFSIQPVRASREPFSITGYRVSNLVIAKVRDLAQVGAIIDEAAEAGGDLTRVQSVSFTLEDPTPQQDEARQKAMQDALKKAQQYATLANITLGKPTLIQESGGFIAPQPVPFRLEAALPSLDVPISPGETEVSISIQIVFSIE
jgi:uncharacterized protein YggE